MYISTLGTFAQRDPLPQDGEPTLGYSDEWIAQNLYRYVNNRPTVRIDPLGLADIIGDPVGDWRADQYLASLLKRASVEQCETIRQGCIGFLRVRLGLPEGKVGGGGSWRPFDEVAGTRCFTTLADAQSVYKSLQGGGSTPLLYAVQVPLKLLAAATKGTLPSEVDTTTIIVENDFNFATMLDRSGGAWSWEYLPHGGISRGLSLSELTVKRRASLPAGFTNYFCVSPTRNTNFIDCRKASGNTDLELPLIFPD